MNLVTQTPTTVDGVKRLAKRLKQQQGLQHARALDRAAQIAGFNNYIDAVRQLGGQTPPSVAHAVKAAPAGFDAHVTIGWRDRREGRSGMETVVVRLSRKLGDLVSPGLLRKAPRLGHLRLTAEQHLAARDLTDTQLAARREACQAARTLQFMDATGLRPSASRSRAYPLGDYARAVPGMDHATTWYDPRAKAYLIADEPYRSTSARALERAAWAERYGFAIASTAGWGMYYPDGGTELYLIADAGKGYDLAPIVTALDALGPPLSQDPWSGNTQALDLDLLWGDRPRA